LQATTYSGCAPALQPQAKPHVIRADSHRAVEIQDIRAQRPLPNNRTIGDNAQKIRVHFRAKRAHSALVC
jgi:hypothetical protein